jgi:hypothetical protein
VDSNDTPRPYFTFSLALAALSNPHWSALSPDRPLRHYRLIDVAPAASLTVAQLRIDEHVLHFLIGVHHCDARLAGLLVPVAPSTLLAPSQKDVATRITAMWDKTWTEGRLPVVQLIGPDAADCRLVAAAACQSLNMDLSALQIEALPIGHADIEILGRLCTREMVLACGALLLECDGYRSRDSVTEAALRLADCTVGPVFVTGREPHALRIRQTVAFELRSLTATERREAWRATLAGIDPGPPLDRLAWTFNLGTAAIEACAAEVRTRAAVSDHALPPTSLAWTVCRTRARAPLDGLAERIEPTAGWDDLVLPPTQAALLRLLLGQVRNRAIVYGQWGFAERAATTLGITALFHGPSGTGKSLAAEVLAAELELDLFRIDLSLVVSKYIGETEKNLHRLFEAAEASGAVLVFDEADALFGKRSEVKDSHDRYANIQVSYLLQRMETYRGLAVLTTNSKSSLDPAFLRRIRFVVSFPFPDSAQRAEIWRRAFPTALPTAGLDFSRLAMLGVTGANIRNIALSAAFLAADAGQPVRMAHLSQAVRVEFDKMERPLTEAELAALG